MSQYFGLSTAKQAVSYIFSFVSSGDSGASAFRTAIDTDCNNARLEAREVAGLASAMVLTPGGGPLALRAAGAAADQRVKKAETAIQSAESRLKDMAKTLGKDGSGVGSAREAVKSADEVVTKAKTVSELLAAAHGTAAPWYVQDGRLTCGVGARLASLEKIRPGSTSALQQAASQARGELNAAPGCKGSKWENRGIASATNTATATIDQLLEDVTQAEGGLGQDADKHMFDLREQALRRYAEQGTAGWPDLFDRTLETLQQKNPELRGNHLKDLNDALNGEMARARKAIVEAKTPEAVQQALETALKSLRVAIGSVAKQVESTAGLGRVQTGAEQKLKEEQDRQAYDDALEEAGDALERLRVAEAPEYDRLNKRLAAIRAEADRSGDLATAAETELPGLTEEANKIADDRSESVTKQLDPLYERLEKLQDQYEELELRLFKDAGTKLLLKALKTDLDDAGDFLDCQGNIGASAPAEPILAHAEELMKQFDDRAKVLGRQESEIKTAEDRLNKLDAKIVPADDIGVVQRKITALRAQLGAVTDKEIQKELVAIGGGIDRLTSFVTELGKWRITARQGLDDVEKDFTAYAQAVAKASFSGPRPDPAKGGLRATLDGLAAQVTAPAVPLTFEAERDGWNSRLVAATQALAKVWDGKALASTAEAVKDGQVGADRERAAQEATDKEKVLKRAVAAAGSKIPPSGAARAEYQTLQQTLESAGALIKTDPQTALLQLEDIADRLARLPGTPEFNEAIVRTIKAVPKQWQDAVGLTRQRLKDLGTAIGTAASGGPFAQSVTGIGAVLDRAATGFEPAAFDAPVAVLTDANTTPADRRAARETALRLVRQNQDMLMGDPLVRHVQVNPFKVPVFGPLFRLLEGIELELNRLAV